MAIISRTPTRKQQLERERYMQWFSPKGDTSLYYEIGAALREAEAFRYVTCGLDPCEHGLIYCPICDKPEQD